MRSILSYRPCAVLAKAALIGDLRHCFDGIVVEHDHEAIVLSGALPEARLAREAGNLAADASGIPVLNHIVVTD